jgi:rod shape-determining protein MreD
LSGLRLFLAVALVLVAQLTLVRHVALWSIQPDLSILVLVLLSLRRGPIAGTLLGFCLGLLQDLLVPHTLGMNALAKSVLGWGVGKASENLAVEGEFIVPGIVGLGVLAHDFIYLLLVTSFHVPRFLGLYVTHAVPTAIYTVVAAVVVGLVATFVQRGVWPSAGLRGGGDRG